MALAVQLYTQIVAHTLLYGLCVQLNLSMSQHNLRLVEQSCESNRFATCFTMPFQHRVCGARNVLHAQLLYVGLHLSSYTNVSAFIAPQFFAYLDSSQSCATCIKTAGCFQTTWSIDLCHQRYCPHRRRTITGVFTIELDRIPLALQSLRPTQGRLPAVDRHIHLHPWLLLQKLPSPDGGKLLHNFGPAGQKL